MTNNQGGAGIVQWVCGDWEDAAGRAPPYEDRLMPFDSLMGQSQRQARPLRAPTECSSRSPTGLGSEEAKKSGPWRGELIAWGRLERAEGLVGQAPPYEERFGGAEVV
jgi:hypothetical protein